VTVVDSEVTTLASDKMWMYRYIFTVIIRSPEHAHKALDSSSYTSHIAKTKITQPSILPGSVNDDHLQLRRFIPLAEECRVCRQYCEIPWEHVPYLSTLEVCSWWGLYKSTFIFTFTHTPSPHLLRYQTDCMQAENSFYKHN